MVQVFNYSGVRQILGSWNLLPDKWTEIPYHIALSLAGNPDYRIDDRALIGDFRFMDGGGLHLGWSSPFHYADGYGSIAQEIARTFLDMGIRLSIFSRDYDPSHAGFGGFSLDEWEAKAFVPRQIVDRLREPQDKCFYGVNMTWPRDVHRHPFVRGIGLTMFETTRPPSAWAEQMNKVRQIIVPCKQNKEAFEGIGVTTPIHVVPLGVAPEKWPFINRRGIKGLPFTFLMAAGLTYRKNPEGAAKAFVAAFPHEKDVRLILKTRGEVTALGFRQWMSDLPQDDRIEVICEESTPEQMYQHMAVADAFVFPSRGEGFGLTPVAAMATGLPVIVSDNSGMSEYCDPQYNYPIPCYEVPVPKAPSPAGYPMSFGDVGNWWEPDFYALVDTMRYVYHNQDEALKKGKKAAKWVREKFSVERTCQGILDVVMQDAKEE